MKSKTLAILIAILIVPIFSIGQTVTITGPTDVEVGITQTFTAAVTSLPTGWSITSYEWQYSWVGVGIHGASNIDGKVQNSISSSYASSYTVNSNSATNDIDIIWGDFHSTITGYVDIIVYGVDGSGDPFAPISFSFPITIKRVYSPVISNQGDVLSCCQELVQYCDNSGGDQNSWNWSVNNGAQIVTGQGTSCISVMPALTGGYTVSTTAKRTSALSSYTRSSSANISRMAPPPITINSSSYVCMGDLITLSFSGYCGTIEDILLDFPIGAFDVIEIGYEDDPFVVLEPNVDFANTPITISGYVKLVGGCLVELVSTNVTIFTNAGVKCPDEKFLSYTFPANFDPCYPSGAITINYNDPNFTNGINTWSPHFVVLVPHHNIGDHIDVTVCNENPCAENEEERKCCKVFRIDLPAPCNEINPNGGNSGEMPINADELSSETSFVANISIYPNPASNIINYQSDVALSGWLSVYDKDGNKLYEQELNSVLSGSIDITQFNLTGVAYIYFQDGNNIQSKTVVIE